MIEKCVLFSLLSFTLEMFSPPVNLLYPSSSVHRRPTHLSHPSQSVYFSVTPALVRPATRAVQVGRNFPLSRQLTGKVQVLSGWRFFQGVEAACDSIEVFESLDAQLTPDGPLWTRWWFSLLNALALLGAAAASYRYYTVRKNRIEHALVERRRMMDEERVRISRDMHDNLGSSLTKIALFADIVRQDLESKGGEGLRRAEIISRTAREVLYSMNEIIWSLDPRNDTVSSLAGYMRHYAAELLEARNVRFITTEPRIEHDIGLSAEFRRNVYLLFKESIHNLVKYAQATEAEFRFDVTDHQLTLVVRDNGVGFDEDSVCRKGQGLKNMKSRARDIGGELTITSRKGSGTEICFRVPLPGPA